MKLRGWLFLAILLIAAPAVGQQSSSPKATPAQAAIPELPLTPDELKVECLPASRASELTGKQGCVAGRIYSIHTAKSGTMSLSLCPPRSQCSFHAVLTLKDRNAMGDFPELRGQMVAFIGTVSNYRGHPRMAIRERQQIRVTASEAPPEFDAAQHGPRWVPVKKKRIRAW